MFTFKKIQGEVRDKTVIFIQLEDVLKEFYIMFTQNRKYIFFFTQLARKI